MRDEERARLIWLLSTDKAVTSALLGKLTLAERYDEGTLADDLAEVEMLVSHLPPPDLADALEALPYDARTALWCLVPDDKRGEVLLEASENVWGDLIDKMSDPELLQAMQPLDIDEQVYLLQHLPRNLTGRLLATLPAEKRARIRQIMRYADNSVGSIMEFEVITVRPEATRRRCSAICGVSVKCRKTPISCSLPPVTSCCSASWSCRPFCSMMRRSGWGGDGGRPGHLSAARRGGEGGAHLRT